jgi:zinc transport system ATP-binding protein
VSLVTVSHLSVSFGQKKVLEDVSFKVQPNEILTVIGPNGAGKSTLIRAILGLVQTKEGSILKAPNLTIGYMPQKLHIEPYLPLSVSRFLHLAGGGKINQDKIQSQAKSLGITHILDSPIQSISGGELQRVLLTRALLRNPMLLVLDEPGQGIDVLGQEELYRLIRQIRDQHQCGILMVSHDLHLVMAGTDSVICLNKHVCCSGHPETISRHPEFLRLFGLQESEAIAIYAHRHNHRHDGDNTCKH